MGTYKKVPVTPSRMSPLDPRERGSELGEYTDQGWVNKAGFDELNQRTDMDD